MRLAFLTDVHFGKLTVGAVPALMERLHMLKPDLVLLGGDITQRGFHWQYKHARRFLEQLPCPWLSIMGNHDVPAWNLLTRFACPNCSYQKFITPDLQPTFVNDEVAIIGLNSARRFPRNFAWEQGKIDDRQIASVKAFFAAHGQNYDKQRWKIVMVHHPIAHPTDRAAKLLVNNYTHAVTGFAEAGTNLVLTGHLHWGNLSQQHGMWLVQAGSAACNRLRGQPNGFWIIDTAISALKLQYYIFDGHEFMSNNPMQFIHKDA